MSLRELGQREQRLLAVYIDCRFGMTPADFYAKWSVTHTQMARICGCSVSTVDRWFLQGSGYRPPELEYLRRLAEVDFLWENFEQIPTTLWQQICGETQT